MSTWARQAARVIADRQPLLVLPVVSVILQLPLLVPFVLATRTTADVDGFVRDAAFTETRMLDLLGKGAHASAVVWGVIFLISQALVRAWLGGAMIRSLAVGSLVWWPGLRAFGRIAVIYLGAEAFVFLETGIMGLVTALTAFLLFAYADYIIVFEGRSAVDAIRLSVHTSTVSWRVTLVAFLSLFLVSIVTYGLFLVPIHDARHAPLLLFGALLLCDALLDYTSSCALASVRYGDSLTRSR